MDVKREGHFVLRRGAGLLAVVAAAFGAVALCAHVRAQNSSSADNPFWGSVTVQPVTGEPLKLSLDDAIQRGLKNNLGLKEVENQRRLTTPNIARRCSWFYPRSR